MVEGVLSPLKLDELIGQAQRIEVLGDRAGAIDLRKPGQADAFSLSDGDHAIGRAVYEQGRDVFLRVNEVGPEHAAPQRNDACHLVVGRVIVSGTIDTTQVAAISAFLVSIGDGGPFRLLQKSAVQGDDGSRTVAPDKDSFRIDPKAVGMGLKKPDGGAPILDSPVPRPDGARLAKRVKPHPVIDGGTGIAIMGQAVAPSPDVSLKFRLVKIKGPTKEHHDQGALGQGISCGFVKIQGERRQRGVALAIIGVGVPVDDTLLYLDIRKAAGNIAAGLGGERMGYNQPKT